MIEKRPFGRTGHQSTVTLFGAAALAQASQVDADRTLEVLLRPTAPTHTCATNVAERPDQGPGRQRDGETDRSGPCRAY